MLARVFDSFVEESVATSSAVWGVSKWGQAKWGNSQLHNQMLKRLKQLDAAAKKNPRIYNQQRDVLIALTAIENRHTLVSHDVSLVDLVSEFGGKVWHFT